MNDFVATLVCVLACALFTARPAVGQESQGAGDSTSSSASEADGEAHSAFERRTKKGNEAYNRGAWEEAARHYRKAAQHRPRRPIAYRNLARTYFMAEQYARAAALYDRYLELAPKSADTDRVERERRLAAHRAGDRVWTRPESQSRVLKALRKSLSTGKAYTKGGGGSWGLYKALLRTGYADPNLAHLRGRLREKLIGEFERRLQSESDQPVPVLDLREWRLQQRRLEAARSLTRDSELRRRIDERSRIVETAVALLNGRADEAADSAASAIDTNPEATFVRWIEAAALVAAERYEEAAKRLDALRSDGPSPSRAHRQYLRTLEAIVAHRRGDTKRAADLYLEVLR